MLVVLRCSGTALYGVNSSSVLDALKWRTQGCKALEVITRRVCQRGQGIAVFLACPVSAGGSMRLTNDVRLMTKAAIGGGEFQACFQIQ